MTLYHCRMRCHVIKYFYLPPHENICCIIYVYDMFGVTLTTTSNSSPVVSLKFYKFINRQAKSDIKKSHCFINKVSAILLFSPTHTVNSNHAPCNELAICQYSSVPNQTFTLDKRAMP